MKNKRQISLVILITITSLLARAGVNYVDNKTMSASEVKLKWGSDVSNYKLFKSSSYKEKAKQAYSIMTDPNLIGKSYEEIRSLFGENDGYFFSDTIPTYIIQRGKNHDEETWQLVFRMDRQNKLKEVFMHKNCCD